MTNEINHEARYVESTPSNAFSFLSTNVPNISTITLMAKSRFAMTEDRVAFSRIVKILENSSMSEPWIVGKLYKRTCKNER